MGVHKDFGSAFQSMYRKIGSVKNTLPSVLANTGTNFFVENFDKEGFVDNTVQKWKTPKRRIPGTKEYKYPKHRDLGRRTRKTLVGTGKLRRAVNNSAKEKSIKRIVWRVGSEVPYARRHNEGIGVPKREYMGESKELNRRFKKKIIQAYNKAFNGRSI